MKFNSKSQNFNFIMENIFLKLHFKGSNISSAQDWDLSIDLSVQDLIKARPSDADEIRFILRTLEILDIIQFNGSDMSVIKGLKPNGYKWILKNKYNMQID